MQRTASREGAATTIAVGAGLFGIGFVLMLVAHFVAFIGPDTRLEGGWLPYWWSYLGLYPLTAAVIARSIPRQWLLVAVALCAPPVLYFLMLGLLEGRWQASSSAWFGALVTLVLSLLAGYGMARSRSAQKSAGWRSSGDA